MRPPAAFDLAHHRRDARDADLDPPLGRDLVGHEREAVAVAFLELGNHAHAGDAADDVIAGADVAQLAAHRARPARSTMTASIRCCSTVDPLPAMADQRPVVRRRIEVVGDAAVAVGRLEQRILLLGQAAAERDQLLEHLPAAPARSAPRSASRSNDGSSLLRPMSNFRTSNDASRLTTVSKTTFRICESIRWPSASTTSLRMRTERWARGRTLGAIS